MRPVTRGDWPRTPDGADIKYSEHTKARGELIARLGEFCSYCEMRLDSSLAVEHVQPKKPDGAMAILADRKSDWNNFLLACANCNSIKSNKDVVLEDYFWPDRDNTFHVLKYSEGGMIDPADHLIDGDKKRAEETIKLTGLDKQPNNASEASDRRWINRRETWEMAVRSKNNLMQCNQPEMREQIVMAATGHGYWSIWMSVFKDDSDMIKRFIEAFPGTCTECFDVAQGYVPVPRSLSDLKEIGCKSACPRPAEFCEPPLRGLPAKTASLRFFKSDRLPGLDLP